MQQPPGPMYRMPSSLDNTPATDQPQKPPLCVEQRRTQEYSVRLKHKILTQSSTGQAGCEDKGPDQDALRENMRGDERAYAMQPQCTHCRQCEMFAPAAKMAQVLGGKVDDGLMQAGRGLANASDATWRTGRSAFSFGKKATKNTRSLFGFGPQKKT